MKSFFRSILITAIAFYATVLIAPGLTVSGNYLNYIFAAVTFVISTAILRPLLSIFVFPFAFLSGIIVIILSNIIGLYVVAVLFGFVRISSFVFETQHLIGQNIHVGNLLSYIVISVIIALIVKVLEWVFDLI